jgi:hypothetical protein
MFQKTELNKLLFLDIETVPEKATFDELSDTEKGLFAAKTQYQRSEDQTLASFYERAGIWAEFGKIICISVGYFNSLSKHKELRVLTGMKKNCWSHLKPLWKIILAKPLICFVLTMENNSTFPISPVE